MFLWASRSILAWWALSLIIILTLLLGLCIRLWQRSCPWDLQLCSTNLTGKTAVVTGANSGIGKFVSQELACRGARVILVCRNREQGEQVLAEIQAASGNNHLLLGLADLSSLASIRSFVRWLLQEVSEIHLLINNAGVCGIPEKTLTPEGLDVTFATNYVGPFLLTNLLRGALEKAGSARVVNVSSYRQNYGYIDEDHLTGAGGPLAFNQSYDCSKLLLTTFTGELARRLQGTGVAVNSLNPGVIYTSIMRNLPWHYRLPFWLLSFFLKAPKHGAIPVLYLSLAEELDGISGKYFNSSCIVTLPAKPARDPWVAQHLWDATVRLTNLDKMD
ncbi:retinol dehydrogenase 11-like [Tenrec ecaudatus]|uniref:retinol dehydrogenase 11-like n=1 Tax=Tenrec ecaudatus TaxID=94439 RepID=UPI003F596731